VATCPLAVFQREDETNKLPRHSDEIKRIISINDHLSMLINTLHILFREQQTNGRGWEDKAESS
jgi:hypothetical protein